MITRTIKEDCPSLLEIHEGDYGIIVIRKRVAEDDDWLGRIASRYGELVARAEFRGSATDLSRKVGTVEEGIQWLAGLKPGERESAYHSYLRECRAADRERWARDRRENPQWYNPDGSHIGINSDGSFRSSYRNTR